MMLRVGESMNVSVMEIGYKTRHAQPTINHKQRNECSKLIKPKQTRCMNAPPSFGVGEMKYRYF